MKGWISLHRKIKEHWIWNTGEQFTKRDAWIDLLLRATHADKKFLHGNELIRLDEGEFITSERKLSEEWDWSRTKVRSFLALLEEDGMITNEKTTHYTKLTICNYGTYQHSHIDKKTTKKPQKNRKKTTEEPQKNTINNVNNVNNENKKPYTWKSAEAWDGEQPVDYAGFVEKFNEIYGLDGRNKLRITSKKREQIRGRLRTWTGQEIITAWMNRTKDKWLNTEGKKFLTDWEAAMRNDEKVERYQTLKEEYHGGRINTNKLQEQLSKAFQEES